VIDIADTIITITVQFIVMGISAIVVAEFFICTSMDLVVAIKANFGFCYHLNDFDGRLQTGC
jgi:hypothetical protein